MLRTLAEIAAKHDTDKQQSGYIQRYAKLFDPLRDRPIRMLELGVFRGGSLAMWSEYFPLGTIVGVDLSPNPLAQMPDRTHFVQGSQDDVALLDKIGDQFAPDGFDIIIDDAAHIGTVARTSFLNLFPHHLKPGGIYVLEDWGTGYWPSWPGGAMFRNRRAEISALAQQTVGPDGYPAVDPNFTCHNFGMAGLVKELVDEVAWNDICSSRGNPEAEKRGSIISEMTIHLGQVVLYKSLL
ncbi:MAG: class I SAM-dependent methyltransferase [Fibrobacterota bacterium]|nr:MAG: class I SAM-dependent methyltransferase [Fibrobacterota bacterium]